MLLPAACILKMRGRCASCEGIAAGDVRPVSIHYELVPFRGRRYAAKVKG